MSNPPHPAPVKSHGPPRKKEAVPPPESVHWKSPWVQLKYYSYHPTIYPAMIRTVSPDARPGSLVAVYDKSGQPFGAGFYNPKARVPLRMHYHGRDPITEEYFPQLLERAAALRQNILDLPAHTDAFRVVHSDGDHLSGLVVDKYADVLSVEVHSLGVYQRLPDWLRLLHSQLGTKREAVYVDPRIASIEGIKEKPAGRRDLIRTVKIREHGVRYEVVFESGHKTGFFCDQRENRLKFSKLVKGRRVLDLCCYTGGFALTAAVLGEAAEVTGVDLDEKAIAQAKRNANINQSRINWVHCDAFAYARQMQKNQKKWDVVIVDPPKFLESREEEMEGRRKYEDLNGLALNLVEPGGLFVTCSCSGLLSLDDFEAILVRAGHRQGKRLQYLDRTGAGPDHPVMSNCPESRYLKVLWGRVNQ